MKEWPEQGIVYFTDLVEPVLKLARQFVTVTDDLTKEPDPPYDGYNIGKNELAGSLPPDEKFKLENRKYNLHHQGRDILESLAEVIFQLGVERGRRICAEDHDFMLLMAEMDFVNKPRIKEAMKLWAKAHPKYDGDDPDPRPKTQKRGKRLPR